jgi:hypothetical protein
MRLRKTKTNQIHHIVAVNVLKPDLSSKSTSVKWYNSSNAISVSAGDRMWRKTDAVLSRQGYDQPQWSPTVTDRWDMIYQVRNYGFRTSNRVMMWLNEWKKEKQRTNRFRIFRDACHLHKPNDSLKMVYINLSTGLVLASQHTGHANKVTTPPRTSG